MDTVEDGIRVGSPAPAIVDLEAIFARLPPSTGAGHYQAEVAMRSPLAYLARTAAGQPVFLVEQPGPIGRPGIELRHLRAVFNAHCDITVSNKRSSGTFAV